MTLKLGDYQDRHGDFYTPRFRVDVGGETFTEADGLLADLSVDLTLEGADRFSFALTHPFDHASASFSGLDWDQFAVDVPVTIWFGYDSPTPLTPPLLVGTISSVKPTFPAGSGPTVAVSGYDLFHGTTKGTNGKSWNDRTDSEVVFDRLADAGFELRPAEMTDDDRLVGIEKTRRPQPKTIQDKQSDYAFLKGLADRNGFEFFAEPWRRGATWGEIINFRPPTYTKLPDGSPPSLSLRYGESLFSFSPELSTAEQVQTVEVRHWNETRKEEIVGTASKGEGSGTEVVHANVDSVEEAEAVAQAVLDRIAEGLVTGSGETIGLPELRTGTRIELEGIDTFTNVYYVEQVTHSIGGSGYRTAFQVREPPATGLLAS